MKQPGGRTVTRRLGVHTSISGGLHLSLERASALGCNTLQIFSHSPRGWAVKEISHQDLLLFRSLRAKFDISPVYVHCSYLINIASSNELLKRKSIAMLATEMDRADGIGADYVVLHTGSDSSADKRSSMKKAISALDEIAQMKKWEAGLLIENTAGERGDISSTIPEMSEILTSVRNSFVCGICLDTCHAFAAGYDIRTRMGMRRIADEIEKHIGFEKVRLIHLNDSKGANGSRVDRHEHIGFGQIGEKGLGRFINHQRLAHVPLILETPKKNESDDPVNLAKVRRMLVMKQ
jgi:deoxyribonuclease-4